MLMNLLRLWVASQASRVLRNGERSSRGKQKTRYGVHRIYAMDRSRQITAEKEAEGVELLEGAIQVRDICYGHLISRVAGSAAEDKEHF